MTKTAALAAVRAAVVGLMDAQGGTIDHFRAANAALAIAQLNAASAGASSAEISAASEWNGIPV
jgi:hypothetical protein